MVHGLDVIQRLNAQAVEDHPHRLRYRKQKPSRPGWYFCLQPNDPDGGSEFICRIDRVLDYAKGMPCKSALLAAWMTSVGHAGSLREDDWSDDVWWAGPIQMPSDPE